MKLTLFLSVLFLFNVKASIYSQNTRITLNHKEISLEHVLDEIKDQSEFTFLYRSDLLNGILVKNIDFKSVRLDEILEKVLTESGYDYEIIDKTIIVRQALNPVKEVEDQQIVVKGSVSDTDGNPLPGVNIVEKGTTVGAVTDLDGKYSITVSSNDAVLMFSFIGYLTEEISVSGQLNLDVVLVEDIMSLDEVVVIGYGALKKSDLTGAVASVSSESFDDHPITQLSSALQGRAAGVQISNLSGAPGGAIKIRIRGANSINGGNNPLFVVDGMQLSSFNLNDLNPADIESIEILKDASATAIYGSRGANGVVLVTTKRGNSRKADVNFTVNYGISNRAYKYDLLDPVSYAKQVNQVTSNAYSDSYITELENGGGADWQDVIFQTGETKDYQLSIGGKNEKSAYFISGRYLDQKGIVINTNYKKYSFHSKIESDLTKDIRLSASAFLNRGQGFNNRGTGSLRGGLEQALIWGPAEPVYEADGSFNGGDSYGALGPNPYANLSHEHTDNLTNSALLNTKLEYNIFDFLKLEILAGADASLSESSYINSPYAPYGVLSATRNHSKAITTINSNILTFHKEIADAHDLTVTGVFEQSKSEWDGTYVHGAGSPFTERLLYYALEVQDNKEISSDYGMSRLRSYVGRLNYVFRDKYLVTASYRADGSSKFPNNKWGYFPSAAIGWRLSEESFIQDLSLFSNLKLRAGYGVTGNQGVGAFATVPSISFGTYAYGTASNAVTADISTEIGDPDLKWEQTVQTNFGIDMGFFDNRLTFSADYFEKETKDLLLRIPIPKYAGGGSKLSNVGSVENKGFEFVLSGVLVENARFNWTSNFNFSTYQNKVVELGGGAEFLNSTIQNLVGSGIVKNDFVRNIVGEPMAAFWGYKFVGIYQEDEAAEAAEYGLLPGDSKYLDLNGDKVIDANDQMIIGNATPKGSWGFNNIITYGNFEFNVFIHSTFGNDVFNMDYALASSRIGDSRTITNAEVTSWTPENKDNKWPSLTSTSNQEIIASSKWLQDASFVRVKNVSLAYRIPTSLTANVPVKLGISAQNVLTFTKYKGYDPEASWNSGSDLNQGIVSGAYPSPRVVTFSLNVNF